MSLRVAIVGRPNVGKSTLLNLLAGKKLAIVNDRPGLTRDWKETEAYLFDKTFTVIDTAGLEESFDDSIQARMRQKTEDALKQANLILFIIDGREGVTPMDHHFAEFLRKQKKPVILGANKCENANKTATGVAESYALGFGDPIVLSAAHKIGLEELYHALLPYLPAEEDEEQDIIENENELPDNIDSIEGQEDYSFEQEEIDPEKPLKIAIVGRPNVGKSTFLNAVLQDERVMTGPEAGITRDAIAVDWRFEERNFKLVDTAGIRRKAKVQDVVEKMSVEDSLRAIRLAQIVILVLDGNAIFEKQDLQIAEHIIEEGRALVIAVNKWDSVKDKKEALERLEDKLEYSLAQIKNVPFVRLSALRGKNVEAVLRAALSTYEFWNKRVPTGGLNRWLASMESKNPAPLTGGKQNRLKYIAQIKTRPPTFILWVSRPKELPQSYRRYIINGLRKRYDIEGVPIRLLVRTSKNPYSK